MKFEESSTVELKEEYVDNIRKEIVAFANAKGGIIYIGVKDNGDVCGIDDIDKTSNRVSSMIRDSIKPDLTGFVEYDKIEVEGKGILKIRVHEGTNKPYYLSAHGLKPSGVYIRQGNEAAQASDNAIRDMIKITDGDRFESCRSIMQELTFDEMQQVFKRHHVEYDEGKERTLGLSNGTGEYTNLGLLLSDQCPYGIKCAVFAGEDQSDFLDRREFSGSILRQLEECYSYINLNNPTAARFDGLYREDTRDFPPQAVREALLNAVIHKDYSYSAGTLISIYSDRMEFVSIGGLLPGVEMEDILMGISICRNRKLADIFYRLDLVEAYGTGLKKIQNAYISENESPEFMAGPNSFKVILPRCGKKKKIEAIGHPGNEEKSICAYIGEKGSICRMDIEEMLGVSQATSNRIIRQLIIKGVIVKVGKGKNTRYISAGSSGN